MADFDPDAFLKSDAPSGGFDPDAFLGVTAPSSPKPEPPSGGGLYSKIGQKFLAPMHEEGVKSLSGAWEGLKGAWDPEKDQSLYSDNMGDRASGLLDQHARVGRALLAAAGLPFAYPMGAARAAVGHPMASIIDKSQDIGPEPQKRETHQEIFERISPDIDVGLGAVGTPLRRGLGPTAAGTQVLEGVPTPKVSVPGQGPVRDNLRLATKSGRETLAAQKLEKAVDDPQVLRANLENPPERFVPESEPTLFQQEGGERLGQLELAAQNANPAEFIKRKGEQNAARLSQLEKAQEAGDPVAVADALRDNLRGLREHEDAVVKAAEERAWRTSHDLGGQETPQDYGARARQELSRAEREMRTAERGLWNAVDPDGTHIGLTVPVKAAMNDIYGPSMTDAARASMTPKETEIVKLINEYPHQVPLRELIDLRSTLSSAMREERLANGSSPAYRRMVQARNQLEKAITSDVYDTITGFQTSAAAERLQAASAATRQRATTFNANPLRDIMRRDGMEGSYKAHEGAVPGKIIRGQVEDYDRVNAFLRAAGNEGIPVVRDSLVADMRRAAIDREGNINPERLARWMDRHQDALRAIDAQDGGNLSQSLRNAADASRIVGEVAAHREAVLEAAERGIFGKLINATDPQEISRYIGRVLGGDDAISKARELAGRITTPEAKAGLRRAVVDYVKERFISNTEAATSEQNLIRADQFQAFVRKNGKALEALGFSPEQVRMWKDIAADIHQANRSVSGSRLAGGSDTAQKLTALGKEGMKPQSWMRRAAYALISGGSAAGAGLVAGIGNVGAAATLAGVAGGLYLRDMGIRNVNALVTKAMLHPEFARELLKRTAPKTSYPQLRRYFMYEAGTHQQERK